MSYRPIVLNIWLPVSLVSSLQGEPRATHDIHIVVQIRREAIDGLVKAFSPPGFYLSAQSIYDTMEHGSMFNLLDTNEGDKVDFWLLTTDPFDVSRFERRQEERVFGFTMFVSTPEDTILAKLKWAKLSGGSEKQFTDALRVFEVQYEKLDMPYLEKWTKILEVDLLWRELKSKANPL